MMRLKTLLKKVPLMGWVSMVVFGSVLFLLFIGSFAQSAEAKTYSLSLPKFLFTQTEEEAPKTPKSERALNPMTLLLFTFLIAVFLGVEVLTKVPSQLHTPLMSGSNAISGITVVGACIAAGQGRESPLLMVIGVLAMICAMINVAGGYLVTDRMLRMFKGKERK